MKNSFFLQNKFLILLKLLSCCLLLLTISFCINRTIDLKNPTGIFGFPKDSLQIEINTPLELNSVNHLLDLKNIVVITEKNEQGIGFVYDPLKYFLEYSTHLSETGNNEAYFSESDYLLHTEKSIEINKNIFMYSTSSMVLDSEFLSTEGYKRLKNLFAETTLSNTTLFIHSPDQAELEEVQKIFDQAGFLSVKLDIQVPHLFSIIWESLESAKSRLMLVWGILVDFFLVFFSAFSEKKVSSKTSPLHKLQFHPVKSTLLTTLLLYGFSGLLFFSSTGVPLLVAVQYSIEFYLLGYLVNSIALQAYFLWMTLKTSLIVTNLISFLLGFVFGSYLIISVLLGISLGNSLCEFSLPKDLFLILIFLLNFMSLFLNTVFCIKILRVYQKKHAKVPIPCFDGAYLSYLVLLIPLFRGLSLLNWLFLVTTVILQILIIILASGCRNERTINVTLDN